ncbi:MAG: GNAT family N-acetyltransferase [Candidatus Eiseniibacteriota bacterium]|nr:MAG: GNAT family N-acetyltransferase [Candidatus Eisenbacteria bacterium]
MEGEVKRSFSDEPGLSEVLFDFLETVFPGLPKAAKRARVLGATWESVSIPFILSKDGRIVSHVGVIELSMVLLGQTALVGAVHAVATHPGYRRRGYYRRLMEEVIEDCSARYETLILLTGNPEYYEPFGFRVVQEHCFTVECRSPGGADGLRLLDTRNAGDVAILNRLLETREPVSQVVGVVREKAVFCFNEGGRPLHYAEDLDVIYCLELEGARLKLYDAVAPNVPPLQELLKRIPQPVEEVTVFFAPDRLDIDTESTPYLLDHDGPSYLMVRGPFPPEGRAFTLPRPARP